MNPDERDRILASIGETVGQPPAGVDTRNLYSYVLRARLELAGLKSRVDYVAAMCRDWRDLDGLTLRVEALELARQIGEYRARLEMVAGMLGDG